jgi:hypothetical protein
MTSLLGVSVNRPTHCLTIRRELQRLRERYLKGDVSEKKRILGELIAVTGYHRKHAALVRELSE